MPAVFGQIGLIILHYVYAAKGDMMNFRNFTEPKFRPIRACSPAGSVSLFYPPPEYCHNAALTANKLLFTTFAPEKWQNPEHNLFKNNPAPLSGQLCLRIRATFSLARQFQSHLTKQQIVGIVTNNSKSIVDYQQILTNIKRE